MCLQGLYSKCDATTLFPSSYGEIPDDIFSMRLRSVLARLAMWGPLCSGAHLRTLLVQVFLAPSDDSSPHDARLQPRALYIEGEVTSSMQHAAASISRCVAVARGSFHWWWRLSATLNA
jgi:hypothetical protein